ncbi:MAG TPA: DNA polymerase III subunit beta [Acidimicrobiales bacterium]|nr:DNA polymerase III subunit beta [Acidimicrobiales bacterium]
MKLRCERDALVEALATASRATASRGGALPVLSGVRLEVAGSELKVAGCDLDLTIETSVGITNGADGVAVAPGRLVVDIVRSLEAGAVLLEADEEEMRISSGRAAFAVRLYPADDFPRLPVRDGQALSLPAADLAAALRQVVPSAATDDTRPMLTGVLMTSESGSGLRLVATDSYRLAKRDIPGASVLAEGQRVLVPARALSELQRVISTAEQLTVRLGATDAGFEVGNVVLTTRLIEGDFPNYNQLIPSHYPNRLVVSRETLAEAVRRVRLLVRDATTPVRMSLRDGSIGLRVETQEVGQATEEIDAKYEGSEMTVAFNPSYLIDGIEAAGGEEVVIEVLDALKPATIRPTEGEDYLYLLMPVRVP